MLRVKKILNKEIFWISRKIGSKANYGILYRKLDGPTYNIFQSNPKFRSVVSGINILDIIVSPE